MNKENRKKKKKSYEAGSLFLVNELGGVAAGESWIRPCSETLHIINNKGTVCFYDEIKAKFSFM